MPTATSQTAAALTTPLGRHEHSTALSCHRSLHGCARSRLTSPTLTHFRTTNNPGRTHFSLLTLRPDSHQRCRTCVTCSCVPCVHDSESVPGSTGRPATALAMLAGSLRGGSSAIPDAAASAAPEGPLERAAHPGKLTAPKTVGQQLAYIACIAHLHPRDEREREGGEKEKKLSDLSCLLAYEQG